MAFLNGIFGGGNSQPAQQPAPQPQAGNSATNPQNPDPSGGNPQMQPNNAGNQQAPANKTAAERLQELMTPTPEVIAARTAQQQQANAGYLPSITPDQVTKSLESADFTAGIQPEQIQKALAGDAAALMAIMNTTARNAVAANVQMSHALVEQGVRAGADRVGSSLDSRFNDLQLRNHTSENPALQHPMAQGMIKSIATQIRNANPNLSPREVTKQAEENFLGFASEISGTHTQAQQAATAPKVKERDWLTYMDDGSGAPQ